MAVKLRHEDGRAIFEKIEEPAVAPAAEEPPEEKPKPKKRGRPRKVDE